MRLNKYLFEMVKILNLYILIFTLSQLEQYMTYMGDLTPQ